MYNAYPYFFLKNLGKKVRIIHSKIHFNIIFFSKTYTKYFLNENLLHIFKCTGS